jgi:hypothetical protein
MPLTDYFIAADDDAARTAGVLGPIPAEFVTVEAKNLDPVVTLGTFAAILTGRDYDEVTAHPRHGHAITDTGPSADSFVITVPDDLRDALAAADDHLLARTARQWASTEELTGFRPENLADFTKELAALAREAHAGGQHLYCWWAL